MSEQENVTEARGTPVATTEARKALVVSSEAGGITFGNMQEVIEFSKLMAQSDVAVPAHLRGNVGACVAVTMQAVEWRMSPWAVANRSYSVNDRLGYESQLIQAVILARAPITGRIKFAYEGEGQIRRVIATATLDDGTGEVSYTSPLLKDIKPQNSPLWKNDPDQQLSYYSGRALARRYFPDVLLGVFSKDELDDMRQERGRVINPLEDDIDGQFTVIEPGAAATEGDGGGGEAAPSSDLRGTSAEVAEADRVVAEDGRVIKGGWSEAVDRMMEAAAQADRLPLADPEPGLDEATFQRAVQTLAPEEALREQGASPAADLAGPIPETAAELKARQRGVAAAVDGKAREVPALYQRPGRDGEAAAWLAGYDAEASETVEA